MSPDQAYQDGYEAHQYGEALESNPHKSHPSRVTLFDHWVRGWLDRRDYESSREPVRQRDINESPSYRAAMLDAGRGRLLR